MYYNRVQIYRAISMNRSETEPMLHEVACSPKMHPTDVRRCIVLSDWMYMTRSDSAKAVL